MNSEKPPLGVQPFYTYIGARIEDLCDGIVRQFLSEKVNHDSVKLWCKEIMYLNEMDRMLRYDEQQKTWREDRSGMLHEMR